ncbi:FAD-binding oxidoreductase [Sandaracinobacteroides saxicola]|uniref:FAD-binding oxidoreductase n=1 Tax=Sandaracinobacteroides saxicola TaxID=2759707 RepID=A0A7G5IGK9_9SPHN|nr:FAD-binding oxidoreductase [Sandaracinobacteroides saxicola]QMW22501.1 FAD-binding oxidoreductase [Sandaracinobacteroides saxicola]
MATVLRVADPVAALVDAVGADAVRTDAATLELYGQDVFGRGAPLLAVIRPASVDALCAGVAAARAQGLALVPRGGGMSYTGGYLAADAGAVLVDTGALNRIIEVNETDMTVTVEAGVTWAALHERLAPLRLRPPVWGTLSGRFATVGGGASQNGMFWGARNGTIADSVLSMDVVLADGSLLTTGARAFRPYGPDLTGLFAADAGAFGVKARLTLKLVREAAAHAYGSYSFPDADGLLAALSEIAREGLASETCGFDPFLQAQRMQRESLASDAKALLGMMKKQGSFWKGLKEGAKVVAAGRSFLDEVPFSAHVWCEGRSQAAADADLAAVNAIAARFGGTVVENTIPKILRANPFGNVNSMLGPKGERWVPVHGILPHSRGKAAIDAVIALYESHADAMERLEVGAGYMFATVGSNALLIEPVFFWPQPVDAIHRAYVEPAHLAKLPGFPETPEARALVETLRREVIGIMAAHEAIHFQIGRTYPWADSLAPAGRRIIDAMKAAVDPEGAMNPGSLGL